MRDAYQVAQVRAAEAELMALLPDGTLMQRAAAGLAAISASLLREGRGGVYGARVTVLAGSGDNGGDALYAGARLARRGARVTAIAAASRVHEAGAEALRQAGGRLLGPVAAGASDPGGAVRDAIGRADLILDGLLGIGGRGGLRRPQAVLARLAADSAATVVAVDLPSGVDADTGMVEGAAIQADVTVAFGALKPGLLVDPGAGYAGVVELVDIGLGSCLPEVPGARAFQHADIAELLPVPGAESDKYRRGVLGLLAGSDQFTGAAVLAAGGAVRGGSGMVRLVTAPSAAAAVRREWPEIVVTETGGATRPHPERSEGGVTEAAGTGNSDPERSGGGVAGTGGSGRSGKERPESGGIGTEGTDRSEEDFPAGVGRVQAWVAGPGMGTGPDAADRLDGVLATSLPVLVDADGLTLLTRHEGLLPRAAPTLLTPHAGELGRLLGADPADVAARRVASAREAARRYSATVLLKGSTTVIATSGDSDPVLVNTTGTPWLATAGTGDVLSGLAGALLAQGLTPPRAALAAAYLHGLAARLAASGDSGGSGGGAGGSSPRASTGSPIGASDLVRAIPAAFRAVYH